MKESIVLGIDPGIADTGYGVVKINGSRLECLDYGSIKTDSKQALPQRLEVLADRLALILAQHHPNLVAVEELFFCNNAKTALIVGQARGAILLTVRRAGVALVEFTPLQVKQAVSTYGQADKKQVQRMVKLLLGLKEIPKPDDAADALAVAICGGNAAFNLNK